MTDHDDFNPRPTMIARIAWATAMSFTNGRWTKSDFKARYAVMAKRRGRYPSHPSTWAELGMKALRDAGWITFHPKPRPGHWTFDLPDTDHQTSTRPTPATR